jgi:hypothetical protein
VRLRCQNSEPDIERQESKPKDCERGRLVSGGFEKSKTFPINDRCESKRWKGKKGEGYENVEVQNEIEEVEVPWRSSVKIGSSFRTSKDVIPNDIPRNYSQLAICEAVDTNDR